MSGGDGMLGEAQTEEAVTAVRFCLLLVLRTGSFSGLLAGQYMSADREPGSEAPKAS